MIVVRVRVEMMTVAVAMMVKLRWKQNLMRQRWYELRTLLC